MAFNRSIKVNKINRNFNIDVRLYRNVGSFNRDTDPTPRFFLTPVKLNYVEKTAFTEDGGKAKDYIKISNRFWGGKQESYLPDENIELIYDKIKTSYPYGYVEGNKASEKKYWLDFKYNDAYQSHLGNYWRDHEDEVVHPKKNHLGIYDSDYPYIVIKNIDEVVKYKYVKGTPPEILNQATFDEYRSIDWVEAQTEPSINCAPINIEISVGEFGGNHVFAQDTPNGNVVKPVFAVTEGSTYTFTMVSPWELGGGDHPFSFSTTPDGIHTSGDYGGVLWTGVEYTDGVTKIETNGAEGSVGYQISLAITSETPSALHYYCPNHEGMGSWLYINSICEPYVAPTTTPTVTPTITSTVVATPTNTVTVTPTHTPGPTHTPTYTPTITPTVGLTPEPTPVYTVTPTPTLHTQTVTPTPNY